MNEKKKLFLTTVAKAKKMEPSEVLAALIPHDIIHAYGKNVTRINGNEVNLSYIIIPLVETYLTLIFSQGSWKGNKITAPIFDGNTEDYQAGEITFAEDIHLSVEDLFVYEDDLADLLDRYPDVFSHSFPAGFLFALKSTGSRKDDVRIEATRQGCDKVTEKLHQEKQIFDNDNDNWEPKLLSDKGKITRETYMAAVQTRLGETKLHRDTADAAWKALPTTLKHQGRPQEQ